MAIMARLGRQSGSARGNQPGAGGDNRVMADDLRAWQSFSKKSSSVSSLNDRECHHQRRMRASLGEGKLYDTT